MKQVYFHESANVVKSCGPHTLSLHNQWKLHSIYMDVSNHPATATNLPLTKHTQAMYSNTNMQAIAAL